MNYRHLLATAVTAAALLTSATLFAGGEAGGAIADANETGSGASDALAALKEKFFLAVRELDEDRFLSLVKENPDVADSIFDDGESLLGKAAWVGSLEAVRILLSRSADPDQGDYRPLQSALLSIDLIKSTKIIVELLNAGADYNIVTGKAYIIPGGNYHVTEFI